MKQYNKPRKSHTHFSAWDLWRRSPHHG